MTKKMKEGHQRVLQNLSGCSLDGQKGIAEEAREGMGLGRTA